MLNVFARTSSADALREQLDVSAGRTRAIAARVAQASMSPNGSGFSMPSPVGPDGAPAAEVIDIETEMAALADEALRFEATAKLLERTYQQMRASLRDR